MQEYPLRKPIENHYLDARRLSFNGPPVIDLFDARPETIRLPRSPKNPAPKVKFLPPIFVLMLGSTYFLVFLCIMMIIPILQLCIGIVYFSKCPINSKIPVFLIVAGAGGLTNILLMILIIASLMCCVKQESIAGSLVSSLLITLLVFFISLLTLFLFVWFIVGNVWVFGARNSVDYNNPSSNDFCHPTLYQFAFWIIIVSYIMSIFSCCFSCCRACFYGSTSLRA